MKYELVKKIHDIIQNPLLTDDQKEERTALYFEQLLVCLLNNSFSPANSASEREAVILKSYIDAHYNTNFDIESLSKTIFKCPSQTIRIFKKHYDMTPYTYHCNLRMNEAKKLLTQGNFTVKDIAYRLGFNDEHYFSASFKKQTGMSPTEFRHKFFN